MSSHSERWYYCIGGGVPSSVGSLFLLLTSLTARNQPELNKKAQNDHDRRSIAWVNALVWFHWFPSRLNYILAWHAVTYWTGYSFPRALVQDIYRALRCVHVLCDSRWYATPLVHHVMCGCVICPYVTLQTCNALCVCHIRYRNDMVWYGMFCFDIDFKPNIK